MNKSKNNITCFIPCACQTGGLLINGIELEYDEEPEYIWLFNLHTYNERPSLWQRIKDAFSILRGKKVYLDDMTLNKEGTIKLRDNCQEILDRWK